MMEDSQMNLLTTQALKDIAAIDGVSEVIPQEYMYSSYLSILAAWKPTAA
jgi:hypothetical protein